MLAAGGWLCNIVFLLLTVSQGVHTQASAAQGQLVEAQCPQDPSELQLEAARVKEICLHTCNSIHANAADVSHCQSTCQIAVGASPLHSRPDKPLDKPPRPPKDYSDVHFVVFFSVGKRGAEKFARHQYVHPNLAFVPTIRKSHPGAKIVMLTDMATQFDNLDDDMILFRFDIDTTKLGRNAWANKYQFQGQVKYMEHLLARGQDVNLVFMDMDIVVLDDITEVFCDDYAFGFTIAADPYDPIDIGTQFVRKGRYKEAMEFLRAVDTAYNLKDIHDFTVGQKIVQGVLELHNAETPALSQAAFRNNRVCRDLSWGPFHICLFTCLRYNYFDHCVLHPSGYLPHDADLYQRHDIKMIQFTAFRKPGIDVVAAAYTQGGIKAAWAAAAALPRTEEGYTARFANFNRNVSTLCWKNDLACIQAGGQVAEDTEAAARQLSPGMPQPEQPREAAQLSQPRQPAQQTGQAAVQPAPPLKTVQQQTQPTQPRPAAQAQLLGPAKPAQGVLSEGRPMQAQPSIKMRPDKFVSETMQLLQKRPI